MSFAPDGKSDAFRALIGVSRRAVCSPLREFGYEHRGNKEGFASTKARKARIRGHVADLLKGCREERQDGAVLAFMEGGRCHLNRCRIVSCYPENQTKFQH